MSILARSLQVNGGKILPLAKRLILWEDPDMRRKFPILAGEALRLLGMHTTSCAPERNWSRCRFTCRDNRARLAVQKVTDCL